MAPDLSDYLASRYLVADPKPTSKKRKRKQQGSSAAAFSGLVINDDDDGWAQPKQAEGDEDGPLTVSGATAEFRKKKKNNWKTVGDGHGNAGKDESSAAADAILASAAAEQDAARAINEEMPAVDDSSVAKMSDGTHAGLQSGAAVSAQLKLREKAEREDFERHRKNAKEEETVYRDATGRRIDVSMRRAEARKAAAEAEEKERLAKESLKGDVQLEKARQRKQDLEDAKVMSFARTADDDELNRDLKDLERWNDPMAQFMSGQSKGGPGGKKSKRRPIYAGAAPPNRYGIKPGYRWDGVDRGNRFEGERFKALNRRDRNKGLEYSWQMDE